MIDLVLGTALVLLGLTFFLYGLESSLFPLGESMAFAFAKRGSISWLMLFGFALGFGTTIAEPALIAVAEGLRTMKTSNVRALIVGKRHEDDAFGIVLLSDMAKKVLAANRSPARVSLYEIMSKPVLWVEPDMDIRYCARLCDSFGLAIAPVIDNKSVVGVVGYHEIVLNGLLKLS